MRNLLCHSASPWPCWHSARASCFVQACILTLAALPLTEEARLLAAETNRPEIARLSRPSSGLEEELQFLQEETMSIAILHEQPISQAPSNVYVITDEDIRQSGATDLPTVLRRIPGIEVIQMSGADFNVSARGDNQPRANKMLVLVDGRSIFIDVQAEVFWKALPITLPEIKRIEVLKGPASVIYGFNAFDGVINIITKSPEDMKGTTIQAGGGEFDTVTTSLVHAGTSKNLQYRLSIGQDQTQKWRDRSSQAFRAQKFNVQTTYQLSAMSRISLSGGFLDSNKYDGPIVDTLAVNQEPTLAYVQTAYERGSFSLRAYWYRSDQTGTIPTHRALKNFFVTDRDGRTDFRQIWDSYSLETQHSLALKPHRLTYGLNYRHNAVSSNLLAQFSRADRLGLYIQDEWTLGETLQTVAGLRLDMHTEINPTYSPRIALIYRPWPNHSFRVTGALAYRPPKLFETNNLSQGRFPAFFGLPPTTLFGSSNLDPEQIISYDLEYQGWFFQHRLRLRTALFYNHLSDLITRTTGASPLLFINDGGSADIFGLEAGVEYLATPWLSGFANYSFQKIGQTFSTLVRRGGPRFKANGGIRGEWENGLSGEIAVHYVGAATYPLNSTFANPAFLVGPALNPRVGSYVLLNLRGGYKFFNDRAELSIAAFNALNDRHQEHPLGDVIGSRVIGWLTIKLP
ncbi:MAG: TonB-dependent receptor [Nitrospirae bacterium]|nr:MAG: TonB-dependent receptor [Nitrospirota bacterium]